MTHLTLRSSLKTLLQRRTTLTPPEAGTALVLRSVMASEQNFFLSRMTRETTGCSIFGGRPGCGRNTCNCTYNVSYLVV